MTREVFGRKVHRTVCPDCQGTRLRNRIRCQRCEGTGELYRLATSSPDASPSERESDGWLSAAVIAAALGKDPLDAAVITAISGNAPLGILLAGDDSVEQPPAPEGDASPSNASAGDDGAASGNDDSTSSSDAANGGNGD